MLILRLPVNHIEVYLRANMQDVVKQKPWEEWKTGKAIGEHIPMTKL